ncbi:hypothetical protein L1987_30610 [Smallanthus sonchifolius]|uniref:Uncharacterized protein n=1 Tax=Smallanthus sonchifolius TaxID=185202 RepID=A0ACB9I2M9_9ASTR|nr:hypothetical protein L1987_30610 [Smallanthus sonchifolius]
MVGGGVAVVPEKTNELEVADTIRIGSCIGIDLNGYHNQCIKCQPFQSVYPISQADGIPHGMGEDSHIFQVMEKN